eukprot:gnl/MRDRNA2_/MRDRNA2_242146_c0_seq1.p1 gnl/MRDRNA2_/MRDRNA2_242146_c0~~gnl/MRDRNA2_/MRDRNA2_242146_c0_seq1.p1  ORF type:complete len:101 (+),score=14.50 gnl/MRDRNA2_/MRDRNA2_242146_c0_seq1:40-303(+)
MALARGAPLLKMEHVAQESAPPSTLQESSKHRMSWVGKRRQSMSSYLRRSRSFGGESEESPTTNLLGKKRNSFFRFFTRSKTEMEKE